MNAFFNELRHARVYRVAVLNAVVSWLVLQLAAFVGPPLGLPSWTLAAILGVQWCGFAAELWMGWSQDHRRRAALSPTRSHLLFAALAGLPAMAVAAGFVLLHRPAAPAPPEVAAVSEKSIAVLPFDSLSDDKSNAYFATGIQDEILTDLAKVADLKVISRTSVMAYGPGHAGNVREIGLALGVAHLLEGSVQKAAGQVRVTAQLIDARTDLQVWAEHYDGDLADIFAIQSQMAESIVRALRARLSPGEKAALDARPTPDLAAFDLYLQGKELVDSYQQTPDWHESLLKAVRLLEGATARDPRFALAYCAAAKAHDELYYSDLDPTPARLAREENAVADALRLQPDLGEAHLARATLLYHGPRDFPAARRELVVARAALPNSAEVFSLTGHLDRREGRWPDAQRAVERARSLDPRNPAILNDLMVTHDMQRRYREAIRVADEALLAVPASADYFRLMKAEEVLAAGQSAAARAQLDALPAGYDPNGAATYARVCVALYDRRPAEAAAVLAAYKGSEIPGFNGMITTRAWLAGIIARAAGDRDGARAALREARQVADANARQRPDDPAALALLGQIDAGLGNKDDARREGQRAVTLRPVSADGMDGPGLETALALICAWTGDPNAALAHLLALEKTPGGPDYGQLRFDPAWDALRQQPGFAEMLARLDPRAGP